MLSRWIRKWDSAILRPFLATLAALGITPNMVTLSSLFVILISGLYIGKGHLMAGGLLLLLGGLLDGIDGELARLLHAETSFGAFLDSISDHIGDFAVYVGIFWFCVKRNIPEETVLVLAALFGSLFGSQVRSRAGMLGIDTKDVGWFTRLERILVLVVGLCSGRIGIALMVLAAGNNVSALQRLIYVLNRRFPRRS